MAYLRKYEQYAKKKLGQNFIIDPSVVKTIATHSGKGPLVLEIGPGLGALTQQLAFNYEKVIAYEIDPYMVEILKESLHDFEHVTVILEDFLKSDLTFLKDVKIDVCANLPYYITTPLLFKLMELNVNQMTLMVQKEVGDRLSAIPNTKDYNALSIQMQYYYDIKRVMRVSKASFHPQPNVESIVLKMTPKNNSMPYDERKFFEFLRSCFQFRRKTIQNNLKQLELDDITETLQSIDIDPQVRAESLILEDFMRMYEVFYHA